MNLTNISTVSRIIIDTTRRCNLNCWYCHSTSGHNYKGPEIDPACIPEVFDTAERLKVFEITITGGEPTLWMGLPLLMKESYRLNFTKLQLITNATAITSKMIYLLKRANLSRVCVSLDGIERIHIKNRGSGMYEQTIAGIQKLREAVDNITVISVLDNLSYPYWPELTEILIRLGVKQHHLAPVCFAGNAMNQYKGLSEQNFLEVREQIAKISTILPEGFLIAFHDSLVNGLPSRYMPISTFTEKFKGWHIVIRPTGLVTMSVRAWGRSWRVNETIGNINHTPLSEILEGYSDKVKSALQTKFSQEEEMKRKFHLKNVSELVVLKDMEDVQNIEKDNLVIVDQSAQESNPNFTYVIPSVLGVDLQALQTSIKTNLDRYRFRREDGFGLFFDTVTFNVYILNKEEMIALGLGVVTV